MIIFVVEEDLEIGGVTEKAADERMAVLRSVQ
jgi:hypothetical protein